MGWEKARAWARNYKLTICETMRLCWGAGAGLGEVGDWWRLLASDGAEYCLTARESLWIVG